ncbi:hypothetical protein ACROYT_G006144 [Oculina patagonica]
MEFCKILIAAIFVVALSSVAHAAPLSSPLGRVELLIKLGLAPNLANATEEMKSVYPFIASSIDLQNTMLMLGTVVTPTCSINLQLKDKLSISYTKLATFVSPLYMAYSYEELQGPQHIRLAHSLTDTSFYLNSTVSTLRHDIMKNKFPVPSSQSMSETDLDRYTREYLQTLVDHKIVSLTITDDVVKIYRNYVIVYTMHDVISQVYSCVTGF